MTTIRRRSVKKKTSTRTYTVLFYGGPLDGKQQRMPISGRALSQKNPRFIDKPLWTKTGKGTKFRKASCFYVTDYCGPVEPGDTIIYIYKVNYRINRDTYLRNHPEEMPEFTKPGVYS